MSTLLKGMDAHELQVDTSLVPEGWEGYEEDYPHCRASNVRTELWELGQEALKESGGAWKGFEVYGKAGRDVEILVVSHGGFLAKVVGSKSAYSKICTEFS
jgi:hypothetical protein